ncbi:hypothetical protein DH2020_045057 [Rehmannia glutinosa]|uniref:DM2 domain-containing protein n=1 Tax=Rehmannia glutinosa TaxID=99300 RepID=A0ABR0UGB0_REHGL
MALSLGVFSSFFSGETASLVRSSPMAVKLVPANLRPVTVMAASKPAMETKKREPRGIMKPRRVSPEMQAFLGGLSEIPALKHSKRFGRTLSNTIYRIKLNIIIRLDLTIFDMNAFLKLEIGVGVGEGRDPADKKVIICDEKLKTIFGGKDRVGFLEIAGLISPHFLK